MIYSDGTFKEGYFENNIFKLAIEKGEYMNNLNYFLSRTSNTNFRSTHASTVFQNVVNGEI
jgi:hypothetical protein